MSEETRQLAMRLSFRIEGEFVNAYMAKPDTMDGATLLGSMRKSMLDESTEVWEQWKDLMRLAFGNMIKGALGIDPEWGGEKKAPEHERSGRA
jgi:hypothetical protein